jgi:hypothetical protein
MNDVSNVLFGYGINGFPCFSYVGFPTCARDLLNSLEGTWVDWIYD